MVGYTVHEAIGRKVQLVAPMCIDEIVMRSNDAYPDLPPMFHCRPLRADITVNSCAANYARGLSTCIGCPVGKEMASGATPKRMRSEPGKPLHSNRPGVPCIRCGRTGRDQHSERLVGRFRLVHNVNRWLPDSVDALSVDVSCFNRETEVKIGRNSKGAKPVRNASLREAVATYRVGKKLYKDIDIGMRASVNEVRRLLARGYPDAEVKLIKVSFDGAAADLNLTDDPLFLPTTPKAKVNYAKKDSPAPQAACKRKQKPLPVASDREAEEVEPVESALDPESIAAHWDLTADGLPEFIEWLADGWPAIERAQPSEPVSYTDVANPVEHPHSEASEWEGVTVRDGRGVEYDIAKAAARFEVAPEKIALWFGHPKAIEAAANASMIFAGKTLAEWSDIKRESVAVMAARMVGTGSPFEGKRAAIQPPPARAHIEELPETIEPVLSVSEPIAEAVGSTDTLAEDEPSPWEGCFVMRGEKKVFVTTYARKHGMTDEAAAAALGFEIADEEDEPQVIDSTAKLKVEPCAEPAPSPKKLTGKQLRKLEKAQRRAERQQQQTAKHMPATKAKATAIASRALAIFDSMKPAST